MFVIDNFLIIFSLEVGGKFIGWFGLISNAIILPLCILFLILVAIDKDLRIIRGESDKLNMNLIETNDVQHLREYFIIALVFAIIISSIYLVGSAMLIRGTINVRIFFRCLKIIEMFFYLILEKTPTNLPCKEYPGLSGGVFSSYGCHKPKCEFRDQRRVILLRLYCRVFSVEEDQATGREPTIFRLQPHMLFISTHATEGLNANTSLIIKS